MEESKIYQAYELLNKKDICKRTIDIAKASRNWEDLLLAFHRVDKDDFLGEFDSVRDAFIKVVESDIAEIDKQIVEL